ncbi:MAG: zf-TFIIB domain-containing protein [Alphaproteobacteria bacterium]|nr:zf-TFIIB domain-containing protein [Alphaproteobacteria bacterium]
MSEVLPCPRCDAPLQEASILGQSVDRCPARHGLLVEQRRLIPLVEALVSATIEVIDLDDPIEPVPDSHGVAGCPDCARPMTRFGYMETRTVTLDRCQPCGIVWIDEGELEPMIRMNAKTTGRAREREAEVHELERHLSAIVWSSGGDVSDGMLGEGGRLTAIKFVPPSRH